MVAAITDAGLAHLSGLTSLQYLDLKGTAITNAGLEYLSDLPLQTLNLGDTGANNKAWEAIKAEQLKKQEEDARKKQQEDAKQKNSLISRMQELIIRPYNKGK